MLKKFAIIENDVVVNIAVGDSPIAENWIHLETTGIINQEWATYRQALRDIPSQAGFPLDVVWPEKP